MSGTSSTISRAHPAAQFLSDLYGPRNLQRRRLIPPEVVFGHGRDPRDVPPMSGVVHTEGGAATLTVSVDLAVV